MKVALADVLWKAANDLLQDGNCGGIFERETYSCNAAMRAEFGEREWNQFGNLDEERGRSATNAFLKRLGCNPKKGGFGRINDYERRQGVRYMWLLLAMHVAEDEGIEIEVTQ